MTRRTKSSLMADAAEEGDGRSELQYPLSAGQCCCAGIPSPPTWPTSAPSVTRCYSVVVITRDFDLMFPEPRFEPW